MSGSLKNKLLKFEAAPPPEAWPMIAERLDKEFISSDAALSSRVGNISIPPPHAAWAEIESFLDNENKPVARARVVPLLYKRLAVAVIAAAVVAVTAMYLMTGSKTNSGAETATLVRINRNIRTDGSKMLPVPSPARDIVVRPLVVSSGLAQIRPKTYSRQPEPALTEQPQPAGIDEAYFSEVRTVSAEQPVTVPAPPIRDAGGHIIMDLQLISKPNDPYITVTGPNGSQTKISSKFVKFLSSLNGAPSDADTNGDDVIWKDRFQSWREKLLNENSFIPAAGNFFDIFEMKDIIQE